MDEYHDGLTDGVVLLLWLLNGDCTDFGQISYGWAKIKFKAQNNEKILVNIITSGIKYTDIMRKINGIGKPIPLQALRVPGGWGFRFQDNGCIKVVRLSALPTGRIYPPGIIPGINLCCGSGSSVGIAIGYRLDGPGIESRWGQDFPHLSRPDLGPTQPPVQQYRVFRGSRKRPRRDADPSPLSSAEV
jgi:hypothetical protein